MRAKKLKRPRYSASPSANWAIKVCEPDQANCSAAPLTTCSSSKGQNQGSSGKTGAKAIAVQTKNKATRTGGQPVHKHADMDRQEHCPQRRRADKHPNLACAHAEREAIKRDQKVVEFGVAHRERPGDIERDRETGLEAGHEKRLTRPASG